MPIQIPDSILLRVQKPARYIGGEVNAVYKKPSEYDVHYCFCFPDVYDVGMCHLGLQILYAVMNDCDGVYCERSFAPWTDMEQKMRENQIPLYSLETFTPLRDFQFLGFTLQYEMSYTNILNMLDLAGVPIFSKDRTEEDPIVMAGGPNANNPEPLADFIDLYYIGEGEVEFNELFQVFRENRKLGGTRHEFLRKAAELPGIYVPELYQTLYEDHPAAGCDHTPRIASIHPVDDSLPQKVEKLVMKDLDAAEYPSRPVIPNLQIVHDRAAMEIFRGCIHGCRFCNVGMIYRPVRIHSPQAVMKWVDDTLRSTGYDEISLTSLSSNDYPGLYTLIRQIHEKYPHINVSLPSLRVDAFSLPLMEQLAEGRKSGLTFAAEAGSQRLRDVINKGITEKEILDGVSLAFRGGWDRVKLYFMLGLPTETYEDILGISELASRIVQEWVNTPLEKRSRNVTVTVSTSFFVPKPFTPFQFCPQDSYDHYMQKQEFLSSRIVNRKVVYHCHDAYLSTLEGLLSRGDRRTGRLICSAWKKGCKFDSWSDLFRKDSWEQAIAETGTELAYYNYREREKGECFPWDIINAGVTKDFLYAEYEKSKQGKVTPSCADQCSNCGMRSIVSTGICTHRDLLRQSAPEEESV